MKKNIITIALSLLSVISFSTNSYATEKTEPSSTYKISDTNILDYPSSNTDTESIQNYKKAIVDKKVDTGRAMGLSAIYFGLGQMHSGETERGAWIMGGGTALLGTVFLFALPRFSNRQESVSSTASAISFTVLAVAYLWNVRDAYDTAEKVNKKIENQLLFTNNLDKITFSSSFDNGISLGYNFYNF